MSNFQTRKAPQRRLQLVAATVSPAVPSTPRPETDDGARQVSWLPAQSLSPAFPRFSQTSVAFGRPLAGHSCGGSRGVNRVPLNPFREPRACSNASRAALRRQFAHAATTEAAAMSRLFESPHFGHFALRRLICGRDKHWSNSPHIGIPTICATICFENAV